MHGRAIRTRGFLWFLAVSMENIRGKGLNKTDIQRVFVVTMCVLTSVAIVKQMLVIMTDNL